MLAIDENMNSGEITSIYSNIMDRSSNKRMDYVFAVLLASNFSGQGVLPQRLGLKKDQFISLMESCFSGFEFDAYLDNTLESDTKRMDEQDDLFALLAEHKRDNQPDVDWMARIVIAGCMGSNHLWQDLGLWSRNMLTELMEYFFPELADRNDKNMKWKKFLYKQLCNQEGIYTCRAPSCEVCVDYRECFSLD